jgi:hypothetical protein
MSAPLFLGLAVVLLDADHRPIARRTGHSDETSYLVSVGVR